MAHDASACARYSYASVIDKPLVDAALRGRELSALIHACIVDRPPVEIVPSRCGHRNIIFGTQDTGTKYACGALHDLMIILVALPSRSRSSKKL